MTEILAWLAALLSAAAMAAAVAAYRAWGLRLRAVLYPLGVLSALAYCVAGSEALAWSAETGGEWAALWKYAALLGTSLVTLGHCAALYWLLHLPVGRARSAACVLAIAGLAGLASWSACRVFSLAAAVPVDVMEMPYAVSIEELEGVRLVTDAGREIPVFRPANPELASQCDDQSLKSLDGFLIREAGPDIRSNCFGWVFSQGEYIVLDDAAEQILKDNRYAEVSTPEAGDLIVYRDRLRTLVHIGVVRCVLDDGTPLIESKWGPGGRFLHRPQTQIYSDLFRYYRSPRQADEPKVALRHLLPKHTTFVSK